MTPEFQKLADEMAMKCAAEIFARLEKATKELRDSSGKGRYCPNCEAWLLDPNPNLGEWCGTCEGKVEYRSLRILIEERHELLLNETQLRADLLAAQQRIAELGKENATLKQSNQLRDNAAFNKSGL